MKLIVTFDRSVGENRCVARGCCKHRRSSELKALTSLFLLVDRAWIHVTAETMTRLRQYAQVGSTVEKECIRTGAVSTTKRTRNPVNSAGWLRAAGVTRQSYQVSSNRTKYLTNYEQEFPCCVRCALVRAAVNCTCDQRVLSIHMGMEKASAS